MITTLQIIHGIVAGTIVFIAVPAILAASMYSMHWAVKRSDIMRKVFEAFERMSSCGKIPPDLIIKCAIEIGDLTHTKSNKTAAIKAQSTLSFINNEIEYYSRKSKV